MKKIAFLVSGGGGTLKFLYRIIHRCRLPLEIIGVVYTKDCEAKDFAQRVGIPIYHVSEYTRTEDQEMNAVLAQLDADVIVTNFHKILSAKTLESTKAKFINLHYSLLPAYAGYIGMARMLKEAKERNSRIIGATCHEVDEIVDHGKILCQAAIAPEFGNNTEEEIMDKLFRAACLAFINGLFVALSLSSHEFSKVDVKNVMIAPLSFSMIDIDDNLFWRQVAES